MTGRLEGKVAIVTGAGTGIGEAIAHKFAAEGARVLAAGLPGDPVSLTRELQRELRRVGCYDGEINGSWTPASRRAMKLFTDRVNASLPMERPDYILLRLVQSSPERVCGAGCPSGQSIVGKGHCLPDAVLAQAARRGQPALPATVVGHALQAVEPHREPGLAVAAQEPFDGLHVGVDFFLQPPHLLAQHFNLGCQGAVAAAKLGAWLASQKLADLVLHDNHCQPQGCCTWERSVATSTEPFIGHTCTDQKASKITSFVIYDAPDGMKLPD